jgi:predicted kinase
LSNSGHNLAANLILFRGLPASGKSTLARAVATANRIPILDRDILKATAAEGYLDDAEAGELSYTQLCLLAEQQLALGLGVVIDGPFTKEDQLAPFIALGGALRVPVRLIYCVVALDVLQARIRRRDGQVTSVQWSGESGVAKLTTRLEEDAAARSLLFPQYVAGADLLAVNTDQPLERCLAIIRQWLVKPSPQRHTG